MFHRKPSSSSKPAAVDRHHRLPRLWSNGELRKIAHLFTGDVVNVSAGDDLDKEGRRYREYFSSAGSYTITNWNAGQFRGFSGNPGELLLNLEQPLPPEFTGRFDTVFNHTVLEHVFDFNLAFANLCAMTRDILVVVVPFLQLYHGNAGYEDYWRFTPPALRRMFALQNMAVLYESASNEPLSSIYLFFVGSKSSTRWVDLLPQAKLGANLGDWVASGT